MMPAHVYAEPAWVGSVPALKVTLDQVDNRIEEMMVLSDPAQDQIHLGDYRINREAARRLAKLLLEADEIVEGLQQVKPAGCLDTVKRLRQAVVTELDLACHRAALVETLDGDDLEDGPRE